MNSAANSIDNSESVIDSRDVIARIEYLESLLDGVREDPEDTLDDYEDDIEELATLKAFAEDGENFADWLHGLTLIRDSYFEDYAREYAEDVVDGMREAQWPFCHIDWEEAAASLQQDYTDIDFDGVTYWAR